MKKSLYIFISVFLIMVISTINTFAMPFNPEDYTSVNESSDLLPPNVRQDKVTEWAKRRGDFFASADLQLTDEGNGVVEALAMGITRYPVDEAYISVYIDIYLPGSDRWRQVDAYEVEFLASDYPEGITDPGVIVKFSGLEIGQKYRLRGVFAAIYQGEFEGFSPKTKGVTLE